MTTATKTKEIRITENENGTYRVDSPSGNTYTVKYCGSGDGDPDYVGLWECNCPAYKYGDGLCKHIKAVVARAEQEATSA